MKKFTYVFSLIIFILAGCSNSGDGDEPTPPKPPVNLTEEAILGTYETYYYEKQVIVNPGKGNQSSYGGLRLTDYDGFRTQFYKEGGKYKARDYNLAGSLVQQSDYYISNDTIWFEYLLEAKDGSDSIVKAYQHVREFGRTDGIMKLDNSYTGTAVNNNVEYKIIDAKATRNIQIAPNYSKDVIPAKVIVDYEDMMKGKWQIYSFREYVDGTLNKKYSDLKTDTLSKTFYKFDLDKDGDKICTITQWDYENNTWDKGTTFPVLVIDDVIHLLFKEEVLDENKKPVLDENGQKVYKDGSFFLWVTSWQERMGTDSFIDLKEQRYTNDVKIIIRTEIYFMRVPDSS